MNRDDNYVPQRREFDTEAEWERYCFEMGFDPDDPDHHRPSVADDDE